MVDFGMLCVVGSCCDGYGIGYCWSAPRCDAIYVDRGIVDDFVGIACLFCMLVGAVLHIEPLG